MGILVYRLKLKNLQNLLKVFILTHFYEKATMAFQDACIFGTGCLKIFIEDGQIKTERVMIEEIKIDDVESFYAKPRQIHQVKYVQKSVLKETFPGFEAYR